MKESEYIQTSLEMVDKYWEMSSKKNTLLFPFYNWLQAGCPNIVTCPHCEGYGNISCVDCFSHTTSSDRCRMCKGRGWIEQEDK